MGNLSNLYISKSYQSLIHLGSDNTASATLVGLQDGLGNSIGISVNTSGSLSISGSFTSSLANGYTWVGNSNNKTTLVPTSSFGTTINTGSFATTGSNTFTGNQIIDGSAGDGHNLGFRIKSGSINDYCNWFIGTTGNNTNLIISSSVNDRYIEFGAVNGWMEVYAQTTNFNGNVSMRNRLDIRNTFQEAGYRSELGEMTASLQNGYIWVGDSTNRSMQIPTSSLSVTGYATTGSNTFIGNQTIVGNLTFPSGAFNSSTTGSLFFSSLNGGTLNLNADGGEGDVVVGYNGWGGKLKVIGNTQLSGSLDISGSGIISGSLNVLSSVIANSVQTKNVISETSGTMQINTQGYPNSDIQISAIGGGSNISIFSSDPVQFGYGAYTTDVEITGSLNVSGSLIAPLNNGYVWVGNAQNKNLSQVPTSSFAGTGSAPFPYIGDATITGSLTVTGSVNFIPTATAVSSSFPVLFVSGSTISKDSVDSFTYNPGSNLLNINNGSNFTTSIEPGTIFARNGPFAAGGAYSQVDTTRLATVSTRDKVIWITGNPSTISGTYSAYTKPTIMAMSSSYVLYPAIEFEPATGGNNDKRVTIKTPLVAESGLTVTGSITIQSGSGDLYVHGNKQFNVGAFQSGITQSGSANVSQSMQFEVTDISQGVSIASNSRITLANSGTYNIQFSSQFDRVTGSGNDTVYVWLKKNGVNYNSSAGVLTVSGGANQAKALAAWNYVVESTSSDYWELCWQTSDTNIKMITFPASGNIPAVPSVILTVTQVR